MTKALTATWLLIPALIITAVGILIWKKRLSYAKVGKISKLFLYPVKSFKAVEVKSGKCTKLGLEVNGVLDRSFMLVDEKGEMVYQDAAPTICLLQPRIEGKNLFISTPSGEEVKIKIIDKISDEEKIIECRVFGDIIQVLDCGEEAAKFLQSFLKMPGVRLVRYFPPLSVALPDHSPFHILSQASIDDLNSKLEDHEISVFNFRPNILIENSSAFEEDTWEHIEFHAGVALKNISLCTRCYYTTNNLNTGVFSKKEPLVTLRKFRVPTDQTKFKKEDRYQPCFGIYCGLIKPGEITVGEDVYAYVGKKPEMKQNNVNLRL